MSWVERLLNLSPQADADPWREFHRRCVDSNGYEREAGLRLLHRLPAELQGRALPLVLARLNDWVPQVRAAAAQALPQLLRDDLDAAWLAALPAVAQLMAGSRWAEDGAPARSAIEDFLLRAPQRRAALLACAPQLGLRVRRWLVEQSWRYGTSDETLQALLAALTGADAHLARLALQRLQTLTPDWPDLPGVAAALAQARFPALRLVALRHQQGRGRFLAAHEAVQLAFSRHGATRSWVMFHATPALREQIQQHAQALLDTRSSVRLQLIALQVLRALQAASLPDRLAMARAHPVARLREAGFVLALPTATSDEREALTGAALADASRRVQRAALAALRRSQVSLTAAQLLALLDQQPAVAQAVLRALALQAAVTRVPAALQMLAGHALPPDLAAAELRALAMALARSAYAPTTVQADEIRHAALQLRQRRPELFAAVPPSFFKTWGVDALLNSDAHHPSL